MESLDEIKEKAKYCLNCKTRPCQSGCPMATNIPDFIAKINEDDFKGAYKILMDNNIFSPLCSLICPQERQCEGKCTRAIKGNSVAIGKLERWVNEYAKSKGFEYKVNKKDSNLLKVAVIGSGPASLSCAYELAKEGFRVTIFEKEEALGGILRYGIPHYRLDKAELDKIIEQILSLGIDVKTKCEFGKDIHIKDLKEQGYKFIFLGIGAGQATIYSLCDEKLDYIYEADMFLKKYNQGKIIDNLGRTVIIGGGNVAMDCARSAVRMGADKVSVLYRRGIDNMPVRKIEIKEAVEDGVEIVPCTKVIGAKGKDGRISQIECIKTNVIDKKAVDIENSNYTMEIDTLIFAIGLVPEKEMIENEGLILEKGLIKIDENGKTNLENVYAGGDVIESRSTVCRALAGGRKAAQSIINSL